MKDFKLGVQLYSVRDDAEKDLEATLREIASMGYNGVELAGFYGRTPEEVNALAKECGLEVISAHIGLGEFRGEKSVEEVIAQYRAAGCRYVGIASLAVEDRPDGTNWADTCKLINKIAAECKKQGLTLLYHNHDFEFKKMEDGRSLLEALYDCAPADLLQTEIDICWANIVDYNPAKLLRKYAQRAPLLHLKDYRGDHPQTHYDERGLEHTVAPDAEPLMLMPVGRGVQNIPAVLAAAEDAGTDWLIVEQDSPATGDTPMESIRYSAEYLCGLLGRN